MITRRRQAQELIDIVSGYNLIDGKLVTQPVEGCFDVVDPATGQIVGRAPESSSDLVNDAVQSASEAYPKWAATPPLERSRVLLEAAAALEAQAEDIAAVISLETGRPYLTETKPEVLNAVKIFRYFAGLPLEAKGESFLYGPDVWAVTVREPLGVVGAIVPWNVPAMLLCLKVAPALATGNTVVAKPAEQSPLCSTLIGKILSSVLPPGVLNIVNGLGETTGDALVRHPAVRKVAFTGSVAVGESIYKVAASKLIPVTLELGGKSPIIIFDDVEIAQAAQQTITGMRFSRQGQSCTSTTRILVHASVCDRFLAALADAVAALKVGDPLSDSTDVGSLVSREQADRVRNYIQAAVREGLDVREIGSSNLPPELQAESYVPATLILNPPMTSPVVQEEIFGPVATLHTWETFEEVIDLANATEFGLSACILTNSMSHGLTLARRLQSGFVQINSGLVIQPGLSFGGYRNSGIGREASLDSMLESYTQVKTIIIDHTTAR